MVCRPRSPEHATPLNGYAGPFPPVLVVRSLEGVRYAPPIFDGEVRGPMLPFRSITVVDVPIRRVRF
jgi:hypothetical protein